MKPCPFCGAKPLDPVKRPDADLLAPAVFLIRCASPHCGASIAGGTHAHTIERWNRRPLHIEGCDARGEVIDCAIGASPLPA